MNDVRRHVDKLFAKYPRTDETAELKEEVLGNVEAEIEDLQKSGISFEEAFRRSIENVSGFGEVIEGVKFFNARKIVFDMFQWALVYTLIAWIITIPLSVLGPARKLSWLLFIIVLVMSCVYLLLFLTRRFFLEGQIRIDLYKVGALKKLMWAVWGVFLLVSWGTLTGLIFGSNIWFSKSISIDGPYEFDMIATRYAIPIVSIILPLVVNRLKVYVEKNEGEKELTHEA